MLGDGLVTGRFRGLARMEEDVRLLEHAAALQGAYMAVLQRVLVRVLLELAGARGARAVLGALREGTEEVHAQAEKLATRGHREALNELLGRFGDLSRQAGPEGSDPQEP